MVYISEFPINSLTMNVICIAYVRYSSLDTLTFSPNLFCCHN